MAAQDLRLAGFVRRAESRAAPLPAAFREVPVVSGIEGLEGVDAALLCLPPQLVAGGAHDLLQHGLAIVECAKLGAEDFRTTRSV